MSFLKGLIHLSVLEFLFVYFPCMIQNGCFRTLTSKTMAFEYYLASAARRIEGRAVL